MPKAPERPWERGRNVDYACFGLTVEVCEDKDGRVWSQQAFQTAEDEEVACTLSGGGTRQVAHALLLEALRREVFVDILVELSKGEGYIERYIKATDEDRNEIERELAEATTKIMTGMLPKMLPSVAREMVEMVAAQSIDEQDLDEQDLAEV